MGEEFTEALEYSRQAQQRLAVAQGGATQEQMQYAKIEAHVAKTYLEGIDPEK